jgi:hypothetical protein
VHCAFSVPCHHLDPPFCCVARCTLHAQDGCFGIERASTGSGACAESARWVTADSAVSMTMARAPMLLEGVHQHPPVLLTRDERTDPTWSSPWLRLCSFERGLVLIGGKPRRRECLFACTRPSQLEVLSSQVHNPLPALFGFGSTGRIVLPKDDACPIQKPAETRCVCSSAVLVF